MKKQEVETQRRDEESTSIKFIKHVFNLKYSFQATFSLWQNDKIRDDPSVKILLAGD